MKYVLLVAFWAAYFIVHSVLADPSVKEKVGLNPRPYRLIYSILSTVGLFLILFYNGWIGGEVLFSKTKFITYAGLLIAGAGVLVINASFRNYSFLAFIGLRNEQAGDFVTSGINAWVRHPIYSGTILITLGYFLFDPRLATLISVICAWIYLWIGIRLEEKKLLKQFGDKYRKYQQEVAAVIPFLL